MPLIMNRSRLGIGHLIAAMLGRRALKLQLGAAALNGSSALYVNMSRIVLKAMSYARDTKTPFEGDCTLKYGIWFECWGGGPGHRSAWVKDNDTLSGLAEFDTLGEAAEEAHRMQGQIDHGPNSAATFRYIAKPLW